MLTVVEQLNKERETLNRKVAQAICEFTTATGLPIERIDVLHHYSHGALDTEAVLVNTVLRRV